ncbi:hypothetical protein [Psychrobacter sp. JCM 18901]|uniref:hypothetical protein n=1 Tax=Psychrobacter sp. JCM 18901 TaxID=1298609 RepID=UPI0004AE535B|nr:hypothetical protein [Psychrobacter sp. JCM 18901]
MSNNVSNASAQSNASDTNDGLLQEAANTEPMSAATSSESAANNPDVEVSDIEVLDIDALLDIADDVAITWVRKQGDLDEVIDALATCGRVALDTEFIKRDTYYPRLALVQLNTGDHVYLLDAPQLQLTELWEVLRKVDVAIWHACGEDLGIFLSVVWLSAIDQYI